MLTFGTKFMSKRRNCNKIVTMFCLTKQQENSIILTLKFFGIFGDVMVSTGILTYDKRGGPANPV